MPYFDCIELSVTVMPMYFITWLAGVSAFIPVFTEADVVLLPGHNHLSIRCTWVSKDYIKK